MARKTSILVVLLAVFAISCGEAERAGSAASADSVDPRASQPDRPLVSADEVEVTETFRLGLSARAEAGLDRPMDIGYDAAGNLYVLDGANPTRILKFDSTGQFLHRFGRHEPDVERVGRATSFALAPWNTVLLVDQAHNLLVTFLTTGTFASTVQIHGVGMKVLPLSGFSEYYLQKWDPVSRRAYVVHMRAPIDSLGTPYSIGIPTGQSVRKEARDVAFKTAVDGRDRLYVAFADAYPIRVLDPDGTTVRLMGIDRPPVGKTLAAIEAERERNYRDIEARLPDISDSLKAEAAQPEPVHPMVEELAVDPAGRLWVRTHRRDAGSDTAYDVFNSDGDFLAVVRVPGEVRRTTFTPDGRLVVIDARSDTSREIVGHRIRFAGVTAGAAAGDTEPVEEEPVDEPGSTPDGAAPGEFERVPEAEDATGAGEPRDAGA